MFLALMSLGEGLATGATHFLPSHNVPGLHAACAFAAFTTGFHGLLGLAAGGGGRPNCEACAACAAATNAFGLIKGLNC